MNVSEVSFLNILVNHNDEYLLILKEKKQDGRYLPIIIGQHEAGVILGFVRGLPSENPYAVDVLYQLAKETGWNFERLLIHEIRGTQYQAVLYVRTISNELRIYPIRPADGLALACRIRLPVYVSEELLEQAVIDKVLLQTLKGIVDIMSGGNYHQSELPQGPDPLEELNSRLEAAVSDENYEKAAEIRDLIVFMKKKK